MPKQKTSSNLLPILLILLSCSLLISYWFFRTRTIGRPVEPESLVSEKVELKKGTETTNPSSLKEIDNELRQLDNLEKEL